MIKKKLFKFASNLLIVVFLVISCTKKPEEDPLTRALASTDIRIKKVMDSLEQYEVQIRYTQITRKNDSVLFTDYDFQIHPNHYFYPASTVKFPAAVAALEKLNELDSLDRDTRFYIEGDTTETTFTKAIQDIFIISDNTANNRLIEFLGFNDLNERMRKRNVKPIRISHRLSSPNPDDVTTKPLVIYTNDSTTTVSKTIINTNSDTITMQKTHKGIGFFSNDSLYYEPFDFSLKNIYSIPSQHELLKRIIFPNNFSKTETFNINKNQNKILLDAMRTLPKNAKHDSIEYYDSFRKFFIYGDSKKSIPDYIEIYNSSGYAYGTITDSAYIRDTKNNIDYMVTATILVNDNGIFNDDMCEYEEIGIPFLAQLGRELYAIELERKR